MLWKKQINLKSNKLLYSVILRQITIAAVVIAVTADDDRSLCIFCYLMNNIDVCTLKKTQFNLLSNYIGWARSCYVLSLGLKMPNKWASTSDILFTYLVSGKVVRYGFINQNINHFRWICGDFQRKTQGFPTKVRQK